LRQARGVKSAVKRWGKSVKRRDVVVPIVTALIGAAAVWNKRPPCPPPKCDWEECGDFVQRALKDCADQRKPLKVAVMELMAGQLPPEDEWIPDSTRQRLENILVNVGATELQVSSRATMAFTCGPIRTKAPKDRRAEEMKCALMLGIHKTISGNLSISMTKSEVSLSVQVQDVCRSGVIDASFAHEESKPRLIELQNQIFGDLLRKWLNIDEETIRGLLAKGSKGTPEDFKRLQESFPHAHEDRTPRASEAPPGIGAPVAASSQKPEPYAWGITMAHAQETPSSEKDAILELLRQYGEALRSRTVDKCEELQVEMTERQRKSLQDYFSSANNLSVDISKVDITVKGDDALATFTRTDRFTEVPSGRDVELEVRVSTLLTKQNGRWKIRGLMKPSY